MKCDGGIGEGLRRTARQDAASRRPVDAPWRGLTWNTFLRPALLGLASLPRRAAAEPVESAWSATDWAAGLASGPALLCLTVVLVGIGIGAVVATRVARARERLRARLREARSRADSLEGLLDGWLWQTDSAHRIVALRPPAGQAASHASFATGTALEDRFFCTGGSGHGADLTGTADSAETGRTRLKALLANRTAIDGVPVRFVADVAGATAGIPDDPTALLGILQARPCTDADGEFSGYLGTFRVRPSPIALPAATPPPLASVASAAASASAAPAVTPAADHESFSFTVSHDLRAPIRVVEGFTKIVKEDYGRLLDRVGNDHLDRVLGAAARMNNMIDALLALSKLSSQPLAHQPVNLSQLAGYVADDLRRQWPDRVVRLEVEPDLQVYGDPTLLRVVVENLLGNAWKYTGKSADAQIAFGRHANDPETFSVVDNGAGFDMRFADRLFGVFQRLHSANDFPGTGVGLASVRRIVRRHGGEIWGEAEVNRGARFHFSLPQPGAGRPAH